MLLTGFELITFVMLLALYTMASLGFAVSSRELAN